MTAFRRRGLVSVCLVALATFGSRAGTSAEDHPEPSAAPGPPPGPESRPESDHDAEAQPDRPILVPPLDALPPASPPPPAAAARPRGPVVGKPKSPAVAPRPATEVTIRLLVQPPGIAHVLWGMKDLGVAPLDIVRPRGSGPLDLTLRASGYLTFHTRAFTEHDDKIAIRMVPSGEAARFPGVAGTDASGAPTPMPTSTSSRSSTDHSRGRATGAR